jgi:hypothetical protein
MEDIEKSRASSNRTANLTVDQFKGDMQKKRQETDIQKSFIELTELIPFLTVALDQKRPVQILSEKELSVVFQTFTVLLLFFHITACISK